MHGILLPSTLGRFTGQKVEFPALQKTYSGCPSEVSCTFFVHALMKYTAQFLRLVGSEVSCTFFVHALMKYTAQFLRLVDRSCVTNISFIFCVHMKLDVLLCYLCWWIHEKSLTFHSHILPLGHSKSIISFWSPARIIF